MYGYPEEQIIRDQEDVPEQRKDGDEENETDHIDTMLQKHQETELPLVALATSYMIHNYMGASISFLCQECIPRRGFHLQARRAGSGREAGVAASEASQPALARVERI